MWTVITFLRIANLLRRELRCSPHVKTEFTLSSVANLLGSRCARRELRCSSCFVDVNSAVHPTNCEFIPNKHNGSIWLPPRLESQSCHGGSHEPWTPLLCKLLIGEQGARKQEEGALSSLAELEARRRQQLGDWRLQLEVAGCSLWACGSKGRRGRRRLPRGPCGRAGVWEKAEPTGARANSTSGCCDMMRGWLLPAVCAESVCLPHGWSRQEWREGNQKAARDGRSCCGLRENTITLLTFLRAARKTMTFNLETFRFQNGVKTEWGGYPIWGHLLGEVSSF